MDKPESKWTEGAKINLVLFSRGAEIFNVIHKTPRNT